MSRYDRQERVDGWDQSTLRDATVRVVGCGALGNVVIPILSAYGIGRIEFFDDDVIEKHNLARQIMFREEDVGLPKAEIMEARIAERNSEIVVRGYTERITRDNVDFLLAGSDVIVDCVDNVQARAVLNEFCLEKDIPLVNLGSSPTGGQIAVVTRETACLECFMDLEWDEDESCTDVKEPSVAETNAIVGSLGAGQVRMLLMKLPTDRVIKPVIYYSTGRGPVPFSRINHAKKKGCPVCGKYAQ
jgi:molybdopterin-synthase adenylyltransferase